MVSTPNAKKQPLLPPHSPPLPPPPHMCKSKKSTSTSSSLSNPQPKSPATSSTTHPRTSAPTTKSTSFPTATTTNSSSISSSATSLSNLRLSLPQDNPTLFPFSEIASATNNFLSKRLSSSSSSSWRCTLRSRDSVVFQRSYHGNPDNLLSQVSKFCKFHHSSLIKLLGVSLSGNNHIYLVYEYVAGASLIDCLRNPRNPNFTPLSKWISRMQVATDLADGLSYIHSQCRTVHNRIKSSSVIVTEPNFNARISHFGAADLAGEVPEAESEDISKESSPKVYRRSDSRMMRIEGTRGYMAPEVINGGKISFRSDIYAFGVVLLELISGREPLKYTMNRRTKDYERVSLIETAREALGIEDEHEGLEMEEEERRGRVRRWVDQKLRDSYPVEVAERLIHVALRCVEEEAFMRPDMTWVAGKISKLFLDSQVWEERVRVPTDFSVSLAPR